MWVAYLIPDTAAKAFVPFLTTKEAGHGTWLGLSQVYGFIKQSNGHVKIYSDSARGRLSNLYLPRHFSEVQEAAQPMPRGFGETVLVVDDDVDVRSSTVGLLCELG